MPNLRLVALRQDSDRVRHFLGEVAVWREDTARLRDLLIEVAEIQSGILGLMETDEVRYEALRPSEDRRR